MLTLFLARVRCVALKVLSETYTSKRTGETSAWHDLLADRRRTAPLQRSLEASPHPQRAEGGAGEAWIQRETWKSVQDVSRSGCLGVALQS